MKERHTALSLSPRSIHRTTLSTFEITLGRYADRAHHEAKVIEEEEEEEEKKEVQEKDVEEGNDEGEEDQAARITHRARRLASEILIGHTWILHRRPTTGSKKRSRLSALRVGG